MTDVDALLEELLADHRASCFIGPVCGTSDAVAEAKAEIRRLRAVEKAARHSRTPGLCATCGKRRPRGRAWLVLITPAGKFVFETQKCRTAFMRGSEALHPLSGGSEQSE